MQCFFLHEGCASLSNRPYTSWHRKLLVLLEAFMVGQAGSQTQKQCRVSRSKEESISLAISTYYACQAAAQLLPSDAKDPQSSIAFIACEFEVCKRTLRRRLVGGVSILAFNACKQKLSTSQEHILVDLLGIAADQGFLSATVRDYSIDCCLGQTTPVT